MIGDKTDAIIFLKSSIARYGEQLDQLQRQLSGDACSLAERMQAKMQQEHVMGLIEDAMRLLAQLGG